MLLLVMWFLVALATKISLNLRVLTGLCPPSVTHNPRLPDHLWFGRRQHQRPATLSSPPHLCALCVCCGVWSSVLL